MRARLARWAAPSQPVRREGTLPQPRHPGINLRAEVRAARAARRPNARCTRATSRRGTAERWRGESQRGRSAHVRIGRPDRRNSCAAGQLDRAGSREARMACDPVWHFGCRQPSDGQYFRTGSFVAAPRAESRLGRRLSAFPDAPSCWSPTSTLPNYILLKPEYRLAFAAGHQWRIRSLRRFLSRPCAMQESIPFNVLMAAVSLED